MARYTGPITRKSRRLRVDLVGGDQAFERRPYPPGQHGRARIKESEYLLQLQEKQKARFTYGVMEKQFRLLLQGGRTAAPVRPVRSCSASSSRVSTTSSTAPDSLAPAARPVSWSATATSSSTTRRSTSPATASRSTTSSMSSEKSLSTLPFQVARETQGDRPIPGWLQVVGATSARSGSPASRARADRRSSAGTAHRRVLLEVRPVGSCAFPVVPTTGKAHGHEVPFPSWASNSGRPYRRKSNAHFSATHADRRGHR